MKIKCLYLKSEISKKRERERERIDSVYGILIKVQFHTNQEKKTYWTSAKRFFSFNIAISGAAII